MNRWWGKAFNLGRKINQFVANEFEIHTGLYAEIATSEFFDSDWYLKTYPDVASAGADPIRHFLNHGARELRNPAPNFDTRWYLSVNPDVRESGQNPLVHFLRYGQSEGRQPVSPETARLLAWRQRVAECGFFDGEWYLKTYKDVAQAGLDPLDHFVHFGGAELRSPGPRFNARWYLEDHPEVRTSGMEPLRHFLEIGQQKGFEPVCDPYHRWCSKFDVLTGQDRALIREDIAASDPGAILAILYFDRLSQGLAPAVLKAMSSQLFERWTALIVFERDCDLNEIERARDVARADARFHVISKDTAADTLPPLAGNGCLVLVAGGTLLREHALYLLSKAAADPAVRLIYSDEDRLDENGARKTPVFKPQYSPEFLQQKNYLGPCILIRGTGCALRTLVDGMIDGTFSREELAQTVLRGADRTAVRHIPAILYHDMLAPRPARALSGLVSAGQSLPTFTIIIPTRDRAELLRPCLKSIEEITDYPREKIEIIVVDNGSSDPDTLAFLRRIGAQGGISVIRDSGKFNYSRLNNLAAAQARGEVLLLLNNDTIVDDPLWLQRIAAYVMQEDVGVVGAKLLYPDRTIQHGGVILGIKTVAGHDSVGLAENDPGIRADFTREISAVTGACLAIRRELFQRIGGLDTVTRVAFNDTLLCLDALRLGYRNIYIKEPLLIHLESKSRGLDDAPEKAALFRREARYARSRYQQLFKDDPYYNPNLCLQVPNELAFPPRRSKPWRIACRDLRRLKILILSVTNEIGHGVAAVVNLQAAHLAAAGHEVFIGGPKGKREFSYPGCRRIYLDRAADAASFAVESGIDCILAETPPFFSVVRWLGDWPRTMFLDHGEPPAELFPDAQERRSIAFEKETCFAMASKVFTISSSVRAEGVEERAEIIPNGNSHLTVWGESLLHRRTKVRAIRGWTKKAVVLNVCRFGSAERNYKGLDRYAEIFNEFQFARPKLAAQTIFVLCGKSSKDDAREMREAGFEVFDNVTDAEMIDLYSAADIYANFSRWEGYNLGIGQALAAGLPVIASDIPAHRAFPIFTSNCVLPVIEKLSELVMTVIENQFAQARNPIVSDWKPSLDKLEREIVHLCQDIQPAAEVECQSV
jgi:GT2 family glycosyltransferase